MCIALFSTAHPAYPLILINNRDEYLTRPTAPAHWWETPNRNVLGGRDLLRKEQGTWLGMTKEGRIAVLTNVREEGNIPLEARSRGAMVNAFLTQSPDSQDSTEKFIESLVEGEGLSGVGGFSLVVGEVGKPLAVISNRTPNVDGITWIAEDKGETVGLSNAAFGDRSWPKVVQGERLLASAIQHNIADNASRNSLVEDLFSILNNDTLPKKSSGASWNSYVKELRKSIFIPPIGGEGADHMNDRDLTAATSNLPVDKKNEAEKRFPTGGQSGIYGTQKQTVVIIDHQEKVLFVERTLYDECGKAVPTINRDRSFDFFLKQ
ncbi:hypothetical protein ACLMJK_004507 [Lecanora helva]